jgi:TPR repeat protein
VRREQKHSGKGNAAAQVMLGDSYRDGLMGLAKSLERAFQLYELAAAQGQATAQFSLECCYEDGIGVKVDFKTAAHWHRLAA